MENTTLAGFGRRLGAYVIDGIIISIPYYILLFAVGGGAMASYDPMDPDAAMPSLGTLGMIPLVMLVLVWIYFAYMESSEKQATIGKKLMGLRVTDTGGNRISFGKASVRFFSKILSSLIFMIGFIMAAFTAKKQGLHDMIAGTLVYHQKKEIDLT